MFALPPFSHRPRTRGVDQMTGSTGWSLRFTPTPRLSATTSMPMLDQVLGRADAGQHQQLGAVDRAAGQDDLGVGAGGLGLAVVEVAHAGGLAASMITLVTRASVWTVRLGRDMAGCR